MPDLTDQNKMKGNKMQLGIRQGENELIAVVDRSKYGLSIRGMRLISNHVLPRYEIIVEIDRTNVFKQDDKVSIEDVPMGYPLQITLMYNGFKIGETIVYNAPFGITEAIEFE